MNKYMDNSEILKLQETANGHILFINHEPQKIIIEGKKVLNNLTEKTVVFCERLYINYLYQLVFTCIQVYTTAKYFN